MADEGYVYILKNEAMPEYIKIGLTRGIVAERIRQLDNTSLPKPFEHVYSARVPDCARLERTLHFVFGNQRTRGNREFFTVDADIVRAIIELVALEEEEMLSDADQGIAPEQRQDLVEHRRQRAEALTFERLGLQPGTVLTFIKDPDVTCVVSGAKTVIFEGEETSLTQAALRAVRAMGYNWSAVRGFDYWMADGIKVSELPPRPSANS